MRFQSEEQQSMSTNPDKNTHYDVYKCIIIFVVICTVCISYVTFSYRSIPLNILHHNSTSLKNNQTSSRVLVVYVFADTHLLSISNLNYFIRVAVRNSYNVDYYFILQQMNNTYINETNLPKLPSYAHYIQHENKCFDLGTIGWFLSNGRININNYTYFIFLNSSVRGPYLVSYYQYSEWYYAFTQRLNNYTKLVGPTINCQTAPHVQSYFWTTDRQGLHFLLKDGNIFACHKTQVDTIYKAEIPASRVIFNAGFGIGSLMKKYEGVDFRHGNNYCNNLLNPASDNQVDGISLDPFEIVFVKLKYSTRDFLHIQSRLPAYDKWIH